MYPHPPTVFAAACLAMIALGAGAARAESAPAIAVVVFDEDGSVAVGERGDELARALETAARRNGYSVEGRDVVEQILETSQANGLACAFESDAACWVKVGLSGDFSSLLVARAGTGERSPPLELRLVDVATGEVRTASAQSTAADDGAVERAMDLLLVRGSPPATMKDPIAEGVTGAPSSPSAPSERGSPRSTAFVVGSWLGGLGAAVAGAGTIGIVAVESAFAGGALRGPDVLEGAQLASRVLIGVAVVGAVSAAAGGALVLSEVME